MKVTVVWATPGVQDLVRLELPPGATVADAVTCSGMVAHYGLDVSVLGFAISGRRAAADALVVDGDRVEITRPLVADPKETRRRRALAKPLSKAVPKPPRRNER